MPFWFFKKYYKWIRWFCCSSNHINRKNPGFLLKRCYKRWRLRSFHTNKEKQNEHSHWWSYSFFLLSLTGRWLSLSEAMSRGYRLRVVSREKRREFFLGEVLPLQEESESLPLVWAWTWDREAPAAISSLDSFFLICSSRSCCMSTCGNSWALEGGAGRTQYRLNEYCCCHCHYHKH